MDYLKNKDWVAVTSRSFSKNPVLRDELLARYENVTFNDEGKKLIGRELVNFLSGHKKAITALEKIDNDLLVALPELKVISKYGVGIDMIDQKAMRLHERRLGWTGGVNKRSVSELVISYAVALLRHIPAANREVCSGTWRQHTGGLLSGRVVGIIGCGNIGKDLVQLLKPFNCRILVYDIVEYTEFYKMYSVESVDLHRLLIESDVVTLHVPYDASTDNLLNAKRLSFLKKDAILINLARGGILDEKALKELLMNNRISAAALDVFRDEPPKDKELINLPNCLVTPHIGGSAEEAILAMGRAAINGLDNNAIP